MTGNSTERGVSRPACAVTLLVMRGTTVRRPWSMPSIPSRAQSGGALPEEARRICLEALHLGDLDELGLRRAGTEGGAGDTGAQQVGVQRLREGKYERLGGPVGRLVREGLEARDRGDVEDGPRPALEHAGHEGAGEVVDGLDVDAHLLLLALEVELLKAAVGAEARVVAQTDDLALAVLQRADQAGAGIPVAHRRVVEVDGDAVTGAQRARQLLEPLAPARHQHEVVAALRELARQLGADARRRARDDDRRRRLRCGQAHAYILITRARLPTPRGRRRRSSPRTSTGGRRGPRRGTGARRIRSPSAP